MLSIRPLHESDYPKVRSIYEEGIFTGMATFETSTPAWEEFDQKFLSHSRIVAHQAENVLGWACLSPVSKRLCYRGVAEVSIYVSERARGKRVGDRLLKALEVQAVRHGIWTLQATIIAENEISHRLHKHNGFRLVGRRERIAQLGGFWKDTLLWEKRLQT